MLLSNAELQKKIYKHRVLNNHGIKLIQENPNLNRNCILPTEPVDLFSIDRLIYLIQLVNRFLCSSKELEIEFNFQQVSNIV